MLFKAKKQKPQKHFYDCLPRKDIDSSLLGEATANITTCKNFRNARLSGEKPITQPRITFAMIRATKKKTKTEKKTSIAVPEKSPITMSLCKRSRKSLAKSTNLSKKLVQNEIRPPIILNHLKTT